MTRDEFIQNLYAYCEGTIELRALPSKARSFYQISDHAGISSFCLKHQNENVYFSVATRNGGGTKDHIKDIPALWIDVDFKDVDKHKAWKMICQFPLQASTIIKTGGGFHAYWKLNEPAQKEDIRDVEILNRQLAAQLFGDMHATDAARILRLPGTHNFKYTPPMPVECVLHEEHEYDITDFQDVLAMQECPSKGTIYKKDAEQPYIYNSKNVELVTNFTESVSKSLNLNFEQGHRDHSLFHVANCLVKGGMTTNNIRKTLQVLGSSCNPKFPERELDAKIKSAIHRATDHKTTISDRVIEFISVTSRDFLVTDCYKELGCVTVSDRATCRQALQRCLERGLIERRGTKRGQYRCVHDDCDDIDYKNAVVEVLPIRWPFQIEKMVQIMPKNIIVVAGEPNVGKSAFFLNIVDMNIGHITDQMKIYYFSSEMGASELRKRLEKFPYRTLSDWDFYPKERSSDFADVIKPDDINIIDYLEIHDNFYEVGGVLKAIYDKLENGIAIVGLQKNKMTDYGLGGMRSLEKPRLYLAMSNVYPHGELKIVKGKNWATEINPNNYAIKFKLIQGCQFSEVGEWSLPA